MPPLMYASAHYLVWSSRLKQTDTVAHCPDTKVFEKATHSKARLMNGPFTAADTHFPPVVAADQGKKRRKQTRHYF
jgi:hypothetical protein